ncbi:hypothetical protein LTR10_014278 [Elasticomyces elasticus]|uniref:SnoaL-like domain-containing protein n=1 Tax=Exophiala sideris TaxID=1016849 RepID=A0ABR0JJU3_9EURO|nr:hypothetical protein LTR10_014278 [Elasticomyces elasticus]KAK5034320.1 hypothetical protein LTS07_003240 [Exophiala sideris]KAK5042617.1 hypothetical protein LTR13_001464 [Exophiala sideris]KAK5065699.1 hypothetical protein LTR69_003248 [Exophiala sideris]KAK5185843.1 hypothetical protein LTR44_001892 [Eurotiomycetes sp. CCFEE 6388]
MSPSAAEVQSIADERSIRNLVARFANATAPVNYDAFAQLWLPSEEIQATWSLSEPFAMSASGVTDIVAMLDKLLAERDFFVQMVHSGVVTLDGDRATGRWICHEVAKGPGETYYNNYAVYEDWYRKLDEKWYFARRDYKYMFLDSTPFNGSSCPLSRIVDLESSRTLKARLFWENVFPIINDRQVFANAEDDVVNINEGTLIRLNLFEIEWVFVGSLHVFVPVTPVSEHGR